MTSQFTGFSVTVALWIAVAAASLGQAPPKSTSTESTSCAAGQESAVLVYFVGAMVFERVPNYDAAPKTLYVYQPQVPGHTVSVQKGKKDVSGHHFTWERIPIKPSKQTLTLELKPKKSDLEANPEDLLLAKEVAHPKTNALNPTYSLLTFEFDTGYFETCSWVRDQHDQICEVEFGNTKKTKMAETMLLVIPLENCPEKIYIVDAAGKYTVERNVDSTYSIYNHLFEIAVVNLPDESTRRRQTSHTQYLKEVFDEAYGKWSPTHLTTCAATPKPSACFQHFAAFTPRYSGFNRPICPLIEGP